MKTDEGCPTTGAGSAHPTGPEVKPNWTMFRPLTAWLLSALCIYGIINFALFWQVFKLSEVRPLTSLMALFIAILSLFALLLGLLQWSIQLTVAAGVILLVSIVVNLTSVYVSKAAVTRADIVWMWAEADRLGDVILVFGRKAALPLVLGVVSATCLWWIARQMRPLIVSFCGQRRFKQTRILSTVVFCMIVIGYGFVLPIGPAESNLYAFGIYAANLPIPAPVALSLMPDTLRYRKIVLIVDESVRADVFHEKVAQALPDSSVDLGTALSTGNCSASSNAAMRWGILQGDVGRATDLRARPSLWQFAKNSKFHTVLIDGQSNGQHQNFLLPEELSQIDEFVPMQRGIDTDKEIASLLQKHMTVGAREFIYVVMRGSHFPYFRNFPPVETSRKPSRLEGYGESVDYATGGFLDKLKAPEFQQSDVLLLYTSDHGQLFAGGSTHCSGEYRIDEYLVPMIVMGGGEILDAVRRFQSCNIDHSDHQQLRTTALVAMGYSWSELAPLTYFPPLTVCARGEKAARLRGKLPWVTAKDEVLDLTIWDGGMRMPTTMPPPAACCRSTGRTISRRRSTPVSTPSAACTRGSRRCHGWAVRR